jgi:MoaA/NifB/PqqE/SkfB family radical SAM enzyme
MRAYLGNLLKLARNNRHLNPRVAVFYVTGQCNLNCAYCEEFGARRNEQNLSPLPLEQVMKVLRVIRTGMDSLWLTGGETLTHPDIDDIILRAKLNLKFRELTLITNGLLLPKHERALSAIDRLIVSLDSTDAQSWSQTIGVSPAQADSILDNIRHYAGEQKKFGYQMIVNAVLTPESIPPRSDDFNRPPKATKVATTTDTQYATSRSIPVGRNTLEDLLAFATANHLLISFSPQSFNNWPRYELMVSPEYKAFIQKLLKLKNEGAPILGSRAYFKNMLELAPFDCYPTLVPRILADGELTYPCRPFEKADNGQGGRPVNLLNAKNWDEAWRTAYEIYGQPPRTCHSCFQQCYIEPSLMQAHPLMMAWEWLCYSAIRKGRLTTYAPG